MMAKKVIKKPILTKIAIIGMMVLKRQESSNLIIMQCTSEYPCQLKNANLNVIKTFKEKVINKTI